MYFVEQLLQRFVLVRHIAKMDTNLPRTIRDMIKASVDVAFVEILTQKIAEKERHDLCTCGGNENA
jgi:hypothetical protein